MPGIARTRAGRLRPAGVALWFALAVVAGGPAARVARADSVVQAGARFDGYRIGHRSVVINGDVYVFGGSNGSAALNEVTRYRPADNSLTVVAHLPFGVTDTAPVWTGTAVYLFGGYNATVGDQTRSIYRFDPSTNTFTSMQALLPERTSGIAALWDGTYAYLFGGNAHIVNQFGDSGAELDTILRYDPATDTLVTLPAHLSQGAWNLAATWLGGKAFLFSGSNYEQTGDDRIFRFDPATGTVATMSARLTETVEKAGVVSDGTYAYVVGGFHAYTLPYQISDMVTRYDPATDTVSVLPHRLERTRYWMQVAYLDAHIFLLSGVTGGDGAVGDIMRYNPANGEVAWMSGMPSGLRQHCMVSDGTSVWMFGGGSSRILRFDPTTHATVISSATLPNNGVQPSCAFDGTNIYVFGGYGTTAIIRFDPRTETVTTMSAHLPQSRTSTQAVWNGRFMYVFGGSEGYYDILRYDPANDTITTMQATLPYANGNYFIYYDNFTALWDGQDIDIFGAYQSDKILRYDPVADTVTETATHFPGFYSGESGVFDGGKAYLFGGILGGTRLETVYAYDPVTDTLSTRDRTLPAPRWATAAAMTGTTIWVSGGCCDTYTDFSQILQYDFRPAAPSAVVAASGPGAGQVSVSWQTPPGNSYRSLVTGWKLYRGTAPGAETFLALFDATTQSYTGSNVPGTTTLYFRVSAVTSDGEGAASNEVSAPGLGPPSKPAALNAAAGPKGKQITLTWAPPQKTGGTNVDLSYRILRGTTPNTETAIGTVDHNALTYTDTGLANGATYYYKVTAFTPAGESGPSVEASATTAVPTSAARNLQASMGSSPGRTDLAWLAPTGRGGVYYIEYHLYRGTSSGAETYLTTVVSDTRYTDTTCAIGTICFYVVRADNGAGEGPPSNEASFPGLGLPL